MACTSAARRMGHVSMSTAAAPVRFRPTRTVLPALRFQQVHRTLEDLTASTSFVDEQTKRTGPVLVALDNTAEAADALKWSLTNLCFPGEPDERVELVHVVCDPRSMSSATGVGSYGTGRTRVDADTTLSGAYNAYAAQLLERAKLHVASVCNGTLDGTTIPHQVHLPRLPGPRSAAMIAEVLLQEADRLGARALVVASHGPGAMAEYGSVARYCYQHASLPLVLIPSADALYFSAASIDIPTDFREDIPAARPALDPTPQFLPRAASTPADEVAALAAAAPATAAHASRPSEPYPAEDSPAKAGSGLREVLLVVSHLPELEQHWQWVADNLCRRGDVLNIWHLQDAQAGTSSPVADGNLASLPTALTQVLKARGLGDVKYNVMPYEGGATEAARKVCLEAESPSGPRMVVVLNYSRAGLIREAVQGSVASVLARHCPVPLVLLQPPLDQISA